MGAVKTMKNRFWTALLCAAVCFVVLGCSSRDNAPLDDPGLQPAETSQSLGALERESVQTTVAKLNTEIMDHGLDYPASDDYLVVEQDTYWYGLYDDISLYIVPESFSGDKDQDITATIAIYVDKDSEHLDLAEEYARLLILANQPEYHADQITALMENAKSLSKENAQANDGHGIWFGIVETEDHYEYRVTRIYE